MARRRTATRTATRAGGEIVVVNAAQPLARRSGGGGRRRRRSAPKRRGKSGNGGSIEKRLQNTALGGLAFGLLVKNFPNLPTLPGVGRSGTVALAIYFLKPKNKLLQDLGVASAAIAGYTFGETGTVAGDGVLASQT
jgi:hypothetical protein